MNIFISHIHQEMELANALKTWLEDVFPSECHVFASSSENDIELGQQWLNSVKINLDKANVVIALISPYSIHRPWINFESGCAWIRDIKIIPVCHNGFSINDLPIPLNLFKGLKLESDDFCTQLINNIARYTDVNVDNTHVKNAINTDIHKHIIQASSITFSDCGLHTLDRLIAMSHTANRTLVDQIGNKVKNYSSMPILSNNTCMVRIRDHDLPDYVINESIISYRVNIDHVNNETVILPLRFRQRYAFNKHATPEKDNLVRRFSVIIGDEEYGVNDCEIDLLVSDDKNDFIIKLERDVVLKSTVDVCINTEFVTSKSYQHEVQRVRYPSNGYKSSLTYKDNCVYNCAWFKIRDPKYFEDTGTNTQHTSNGIFSSTNDWLLPGEGVSITYKEIIRL